MTIDIKQRKSILAHLAQKAETEPAALQVIQKEYVKITTALENEVRYDNITDQLELLDTIAYRVYIDAVNTIRIFLERLKDLELTYQEIPGYPAERIREYQNNHTLMVQALEVLERIRYHQPSVILDIFLDYSCHEEEIVANQAKHGIEKLASYDLDIFYGDGKEWSGLGWEPQEKILEKINSLDKIQKQKYFSAIIVACKQILSPTISGVSSTFNTVTLRASTLPAIAEVKEVRKKAIVVLQNLYALAKNVEQKKAILNAMVTATHIPHRGEYGGNVQAMIIENTIAVVEFMKDIAVSGDMQIMQKVEHDAYWLLYHKGALNKTIKELALEIRDTLYANEEYQKFRILIGFESIFHDWEKDANESIDYDWESKFRETETLNLAESVDTDSYNDWKERITRYASIKSSDMAMFPYFGKFLEHFGKTSPDLALKLLLETSDQLENFIVAILCGVTKTEHKEAAYALIERWCDEGRYLFSLARFFEFSSEVNKKLLKKILDKAIASNDLNTLNQIISSVSVQYEHDKHLIQKIFIPALKTLTSHKDPTWIFGFWFRKQRSIILSSMKSEEHKAILDNLFWLQEIDYHAEEILCVIANKSPKLVIEFFCNRLSKKNDEEDIGRYNAIPFSFHKLSEPLSKYPVQAVDAVLNIYDGNYGLFVYRGARLLKNIFPNFPPELQLKLLDLVRSGEEKDLLFVMAILSNYEGNTIIHEICKEIVKILPDSSDLTNELSAILQSTGVVSGEYGYVEAYKQKIEEIRPWQLDESFKIKEFAKNYIESLEKQISYEQKRADEYIALLKHQYGGSKN